MINDSLLDHADNRWFLNGVPYYGSSTAHGDFFHYENGYLHKEDGPAIEWEDGGKEWCIHSKLHREDGPAVDWANGTKLWLKHGKHHREDGPAIVWSDGSKEWWIQGIRINTWKQYHNLSTLSPQEQMIVKLKYGEDLK